MNAHTHHDVVIVGGGAAGLSAALTLARARRSVLVVDAGAPGNAAAEGVHGCLGNEGVPPHELLAAGRAEVRGYGGRIRQGTAVGAHEHRGNLRVVLADGTTVSGARLLLATGLADELPSIPGLAAQWGRRVITCPHCHGWELRDRAIGILAGGLDDVEMALVWRQWSTNLTYFTHVTPGPDPQETQLLAARGITVVRGEVAAVQADTDHLTGVRMAEGTVLPVDALVVSTRSILRSSILTGLRLTPRHTVVDGRVVADYLETDAKGRTSSPNVWAAGNITAPAAKFAEAAAAGVRAAIEINRDLVHEDTHRVMNAAQDWL